MKLEKQKPLLIVAFEVAPMGTFPNIFDNLERNILQNLAKYDVTTYGGGDVNVIISAGFVDGKICGSKSLRISFPVASANSYEGTKPDGISKRRG